MFNSSGVSSHRRALRSRHLHRPVVSGWTLSALALLFAASAGAAEAPSRYWIFWGPGWEDQARKAAEVALAPVSERAERRLARVGYRRSADQPADRPIPTGFLRYLEELGIAPGYASRLLRAVAADLNDDQRAALAADPSVVRLEPIRPSVRRLPEATETYRLPEPAGRSTLLDTLPDPRALTRADYGAAYAQCAQLQIPTLHRLGYSGKGVMVCLLDGGFWRGHEAFGLADVDHAWDFVEKDRTVGYDPNRPGHVRNTEKMNEHGTFTWSALGGYKQGKQIGPAYRATFALGRTEIVEVEQREEEEHYVAGLEWADSLGADLVSTSLGYRWFDNNYEYWPTELDGRHAVTSLGAARLTRRGVLLVTAMGNEGPDSMSISTPADAESVCSVGAVNAAGVIAGFSSRGPNALGQVKPDVSARGVATACASASDGDAYAFVNGTSLSTPLIGGLAALLIEAHPDWGPMEVLEALRSAGDQVNEPDNARGYGVPDGLVALGLVGGASGGQALLSLSGVSWGETAHSAHGEFGDSLANPGEEGSLALRLVNRGSVASEPARIALAGVPAGLELLGDSIEVPALPPGGTYVTTAWLRLRIDPGQAVPASAPLAVRLRTASGGSYFRPVVLPVVAPTWATSPYPNPLLAAQALTLDLDLPGEGTHSVTIEVFDVAGRLREVPYRDHLIRAQGRLIWQPDRDLPAGVYFLRIHAPGYQETRRVALIR